MKLTIKQTLALDYLEDQTTREVLYGGAAGGGKSILGSYWLLKMAFKYPGTRWLMGRSELKTLKKTTLNSFFEVCKMMGLKSGKHYKLHQQDNIVYIPNGSQILLADLYAYPSDPDFDSLGSLEITGAFLDECNQMSEKAKNIVKSRIRYKIDEFGLVPKQLMSCNPAKNWVYQEFYKPYKQGVLSTDKKFIQALVTDNDFISKHYIENLRSLDKVSRERLLDGNWEYDDDPSALMDFGKILWAFDNEGLEGGEKFITADVARFGFDKTVIAIWNGFRVELHTYSKKSVKETADQIREFSVIYGVPNHHILVDEDGVGGGVVDILRCRGFVNNARPLRNPVTGNEENYQNLKSQCYYMLAERVNKGGIYIESDKKQVIIEELEQVKQYKMDSDGKKAVLPKEKLKELLGRSPDYADALMMREWFELTPKFSWLAF